MLLTRVNNANITLQVYIEMNGSNSQVPTKLSFTQVDSCSNILHLSSLFCKHEATFSMHTVDAWIFIIFSLKLDWRILLHTTYISVQQLRISTSRFWTR